MSVAEEQVVAPAERRPTFVDPEFVAADLDVHVSTVYRALRANPPEMPGRKVRHQWRIPIDQYEAYRRGEWEPKAPPDNIVPMRRAAH